MENRCFSITVIHSPGAQLFRLASLGAPSTFPSAPNAYLEEFALSFCFPTCPMEKADLHSVWFRSVAVALRGHGEGRLGAGIDL